MRVLWFPGNGCIYATTNKYNGGGWTGALAKALMSSHPDITLGMAIPWNKDFHDIQNGVDFYGIPQIHRSYIGYNKKQQQQVQIIKTIVEDFNPDIIHVFGSEHSGGLVATVTDIPVVLHLQGILNYLTEAWLPYNLSWGKLFTWRPKQIFDKLGLIRGCAREKQIFKACHHYMGRTEMDQRVINILSPKSKYYYCSEMLRPEIYFSEQKWKYRNTRSQYKIMSVISSPFYKGGDIILRASKFLKEDMHCNFEWNVYGVDNMKVWERLTNIKAKDVNVNIRGIIDAKGLVDTITSSDVFVHPSYIENSPNTVCEAQVLGIPVIANHVGGISSLINNMEDGVLLPANDCYMTASFVKELCENEQIAIKLGENARNVAHERHSPQRIVKDVIDIYNSILCK